MLRLSTPSPTQLSRWRRTAVAVDEVSRLIFPLGFLVFTASYWFYFYFSVGVDQVSALHTVKSMFISFMVSIEELGELDYRVPQNYGRTEIASEGH